MGSSVAAVAAAAVAERHCHRMPADAAVVAIEPLDFGRNFV